MKGLFIQSMPTSSVGFSLASLGILSILALLMGGCGQSGSSVALDPSEIPSGSLSSSSLSSSPSPSPDPTLSQQGFPCPNCVIRPSPLPTFPPVMRCTVGFFGLPNTCQAVVTTPDDIVNANDGLVSLREAVAMVPRVGYELQVSFSTSVISQGVVTLSQGTLNFPQSVKISGPTQGSLAISGNNSFYLFEISSGKRVQFSNLTLQRGTNTTVDGRGGAILNQGNLTLNSVVISDSVAKYGAGIHNSGQLVLNGSTVIRNNIAVFNGGGIYNEGILTLNDQVVITQNQANGTGFRRGGGGVQNFNLSNSVVVNGNRDPNLAVTGNTPDNWRCTHRACF